MKRWALIIFLAIICISTSFGQKEKILRGVSEFRKIMLRSNALAVSQIEGIGKSLDSLEVDSTEYFRFLSNLYIVSKNLYTRNALREYQISNLKKNRIYDYLTDEEIAILIDNFHITFLPLNGLWRYRYPHQINTNAPRISEIANYGIKDGDRVLNYLGYRYELCPILYLSYDDIDISHYPLRYSNVEKKIYESLDKETKSKSLKYPPIKNVELDESIKYDIVVFNGLGFLTRSIREGFKFKFKQIHRLLKDDGVLVMSANATYTSFDGPFDLYEIAEKRLKDVYKLGFKLQEKILVEDEYVVFKLVKDKK